MCAYGVYMIDLFRYAVLYDRLRLIILAEAQNWRCCYCGIRCIGEHNTDDRASIDHFVPINAGGKRRDWYNEIMACRKCNQTRGSMRAIKFYNLVLTYGRDKGHELAAKISSRVMSANAKRRRERRWQHR